ncbi:Protein-tyrosine-phosphatase OS=Streptomyces microflavus OX=1919 GN=Smic_00270 PE=4 SV=1 [Streptomyces microflavus]
MQTARTVPAATVVDLRDLGGIALGRGHRVRQGVLFRSGQLSELDPDRDRAVAALDIRTVVDLRTADERQWAPDRLPDRARLFVADVLGDHPGVAPARLKALLADPDEAERMLGGGGPRNCSPRPTARWCSRPAPRPAYRAFLETAADPGARPVSSTARRARTVPAGRRPSC